MLTNQWDKIGPGHVWNLGKSETELRLLEMVADQTSGAVREQAAKALATIGVEIKPEAPADGFEPFPASLLEALPSGDDFSGKHLVTVRMAAAVAVRTKADLVQGFAKEPEASMEFHEVAEGTASFLRALANLCEIAAGRMLLAGEAQLKAHEEGK